MLSRAALRKLMGQAASAGSLQTVYQTALRCVQEALDVERTSLLVFDASGTMRFVAWSSLSDEYRAAVDGHSPWSADETAASPVLVPDVEQNPSLAPFAPVCRREDIRALAFVPVQFGPTLFGKIMLYYREPHAFSDGEIAIAQQIADHVAFALEHHRIAVALEERLVAERDLRQRAETEAASRQANESRLRLALATGHMGAWDWDIKGGQVEWSAELEAIHGLGSGEFSGTLEAFRRDVYPADAERIETAITKALKSPDSGYAIEYRIVRPDGTLRWLSATGRVLVDGDGSPSRMVGICRDVTERKRAEEASEFLADVSRVLATTLDPEMILENVAHSVVPRLADWCVVQVADAEGHFEPVEIAHQEAGRIALMRELVRRSAERPHLVHNPIAVATSGRPNLIPRVTDEILQAFADDHEHLSQLRSMRVCSAITVPLQARGRTLGALSLLSSESGRVYDHADLRFAEEIASWAALAIDNAQLYRQTHDAREAAERARGQLEALARVSDQVAVSLDPNEALQQLAARVVPTFADYCVTYAADDTSIEPLGFAHRNPAKTALVEALAHGVRVSVEDPHGPGLVIRRGEPCLTEEFVSDPVGTTGADSTRDRHRALAPRSMMIVPLRARGRTLGAIALAATDESGRRFGEADLKIAMELASRAALLVDNARLYAEARSAIRARNDMIAVASHDLRDPLQSISAAAAALRLETESAEAAESIDSIAAASAQMRRLVQDLLDISLIDAGHLPIEKTSVDLGDLINEAQTLFQPQVESKAVRIERSLAPHLPPVSIDRHRILQVLLNLMGNALKFVPEGGLITVGAEKQDGLVRVWVEDTGVGIPADQLDRVFDRFWRADRLAGGGAGLGLAVAKGIVEAHGGRIGVDSRPGIGSTFHFTLHPYSTALERHRVAPDWARAQRVADVWAEGQSEFHRLLDGLPAAAYTCTADGLMTYFNERALELWGRVPRLNDPRDRFCGSWRIRSAGDTLIDHDQCWMALALKDRRHYTNRELVIERPDGTRREALAYASPIYDGSGARLIGAVGVLWDVTEHKQAEAALLAADRRNDEFLAALAHALRNPLTPLRAGVAIIQNAIGDPDTIAEHCTLMERQLRQLTRLVDDLLDVSSLTQRTLQLERSRVEIKAVARTVLEENRSLITQAEHTLSVTLPAEPIFLDADPLRLGQALSHLLGNAAKYTPRGGRLEFTAALEGTGVRVTVRDSGYGIAADKLDAIFEMFGQLDRSLETGYKGLGIGLTLVKALVEMHGGTVEARSDGPGRGSEFTVWLPRAHEPAPAPAPPAAGPRSPAISRRVLLVDDDRDVAGALSRLVRLLGHTIRVAFDGQEALRIADEFDPDVVLMDIGLPNLNGYDTARKMRQKSREGMMLVAVTGWGGDADRRRSHEAGFDWHLTKPVEPDVLEALLSG